MSLHSRYCRRIDWQQGLLSVIVGNPTARWMSTDIEVQDAATVVADDQKAVEHTEPESGDREEVHRCDRFAVITQKSQPRLAGSGSLGARLIQRETVVSDTAKPSIRSSPWMRGAPQL